MGREEDDETSIHSSLAISTVNDYDIMLTSTSCDKLMMKISVTH